MATTYNNLYLDTRARLKKAGIEGAQLEARELICYAADKSREQFYRDMPLYASGELEKRVEALVQRRLEGEPVAYIVGEWEFYGLPLDAGPVRRQRLCGAGHRGQRTRMPGGAGGAGRGRPAGV